ncbi:MAG TPA: YceI family protein [Pseudolysinimonas sp.]|nr:YceI family protein [Pseudolysinimonas sp.]
MPSGTWKLDPTHSELTFSVKHLMISKVKGVFKDFDVTVVTAENPADSKVEATVQVASVDTKQKDRDQHLLAGDFFLADEHPEVTFTSTTIDANGEDFTIAGDLTLRGVTKPVTLTGEFGGVATDPYGQTKAGATASTVINRQDFGVSFNQVLETGGFALGDDIKVEIDLQVVLQP